MSAPSPLRSRLEQHGDSVPAAPQKASLLSGAHPDAAPDLREVRFAADTKDNEDKSRGHERFSVRGRVGFRVGRAGEGEDDRDRDSGRDKRNGSGRDGEMDMDDDVPLGYAIQAKKKREEKERFLRAERDKRGDAAEEERKREEEEDR